MLKKILIPFVIYSVVLLLIGRNLAFLPLFDFRSEEKKSEDLRKNVIEKFLKTQKGSYSVYYKNLETGQEFGIDENKVLTGASLNKLLIISYLYSLASKGKINLEDKVVIQKDDIQDYGTGSLRYAEEGDSYSLKQLTKLSLEQSDNTAAHLLAIKLEGLLKIQEYGKKLGLSQTDMENNKTSAHDIGRILELIYQGKVTNTQLKNEFLDFMKDTDFEDRLARDLPAGVLVFHKAADGTGFIHDAGIIESGSNKTKKAFILAVLSENIEDEDQAKRNIGKIAKFIYDNGN